METSPDKKFFFLSVAVMGVAAGYWMSWITALGPGVSPDSLVYIATAKNLLAGNGFFAQGSPMTQFPPLYPVSLALGGLIHPDILSVARVMHSLIYAINGGLVALILYQATAKSYWAGILGLLAFVAAVSLMQVHAVAWSEPLFITFILSASLIFPRYIMVFSPIRLVVSAVLAALAMTTRYIGLSLLLAMSFHHLMMGWRLPWTRRLINICWLASIAAIPLSLWLLRNLILAGTATSRHLQFHAISFSHLKQALETLYGFILPFPAEPWVQAMLMIWLVMCMMAALTAQYRALSRVPDQYSVSLAYQVFGLLFCGFYGAFLVVSLILFDAHIPLDARILSPLFVIWLILIIASLWNAIRLMNSKWLKAIAFVIVVLLLTINATRAFSLATRIHEQGLGFSSPLWTRSNTLAFLGSLSQDSVFYSNGADIIEYFTSKRARSLPAMGDPRSLVRNQTFEHEMALMCTELAQGRARLVYLNHVDWRWYLPSRSEFEPSCPALQALVFDDGIIYEAVPGDMMPVSPAFQPDRGVP